MDLPALRLRPLDPRPVPCKICQAPAPLFGVQDFNRSCEEQRGKFLPLSGVPVYYRRCPRCGLIFTDAFDDWSDEEFARHIYNEGYIDIDPEFAIDRPAHNAGLIARTFRGHEESLDVVDYGGGNGWFARQLTSSGFRSATTYDRFHPDHRERPAGTFNLVTTFETIEHMPDPVAGAADLVSFLAEDGLIVISTLIQPQDILKERMHWWYAGPRNGHVTLFTYGSLARLFAPLGLKIYPSSSPALHFACREIPSYAREIMRLATPVPV